MAQILHPGMNTFARGFVKKNLEIGVLSRDRCLRQ
jgi:hypothetical protein